MYSFYQIRWHIRCTHRNTYEFPEDGQNWGRNILELQLKNKNTVQQLGIKYCIGNIVQEKCKMLNLKVSTCICHRSLSWDPSNYQNSVVNFCQVYDYKRPIPAARGSKACLRLLACWDWGFESRREHGSLSLVIVVRYQVEVSESGWSLVQRSPTECGVCDRAASILGRPWPTGGCSAMGGKYDCKYPA
jgi:hypothetical protein